MLLIVFREYLPILSHGRAQRSTEVLYDIVKVHKFVLALLLLEYCTLKYDLPLLVAHLYSLVGDYCSSHLSCEKHLPLNNLC